MISLSYYTFFTHLRFTYLFLLCHSLSLCTFIGEGWPLIDQLEDACVPPVDGIYQPGVPLPVVVHYCQNFRAGLLGFAKRQVHRDIFTCEHPLFIEPPLDLGSTEFRIKDGEVRMLLVFLIVCMGL